MFIKMVSLGNKILISVAGIYIDFKLLLDEFHDNISSNILCYLLVIGKKKKKLILRILFYVDF